MSDEYEFPNHPVDVRYPNKEEKRDTAWIGIANSTKHNLEVRTEIGGNTAAGDIFAKVENSISLAWKLISFGKISEAVSPQWVGLFPMAKTLELKAHHST